jgi:hypothetical protein
MSKALIGAMLALGLAGATIAVSAPATARVGVSLDVGNVAFGYQDGYWDQGHRWHHWRNRRDARMYRNAHGSQYNNYRHDRDPDQGWRR